MSSVEQQVGEPQPLTDHGQAQFADERIAFPVPDASRADKATSFDLSAFPQPTGREEDWRFSPLDRIRSLLSGETEFVEPSIDVVADSAAIIERVGRTDSRLGTILVPSDRAAALGWNRFTSATIVTVPKNTQVPTDIRISVAANAQTCATHLGIWAEQSSKAVVVLDHRGSGRLLENMELSLADDAQLTIISLQEWDRDAIHLGAHRAELGNNARLRHIVVTLGGDMVRLTSEAALTSPGGDVEMLGAYFADRGQHQEHRLFLDHRADHCRSRVTYKGALHNDGAHTVWIGDALIRAQAEGTDTYELNRNLILTDGARADSVPNLEIETGEIEGAGHASATGRFDEEQLFYLGSRGIPENEARRLVVQGFFAELIAQIDIPEVEERLMAAIEADLDRTL